MTLLSQKITKPNLNTNTWKCKKNRWKINYWRCCEMAKKRWKEDGERTVGSFWASLTYFKYRKNPPKSKIKYAVIRWLKIMLWDGKKRGGKKMERGWLPPFKSQFQSQFWPLFNLNIGKSPRNQRSRILFKSDDWKSCCEMAKKRWKEDVERLVGSLQVPLSQR